MKHWVLTLLLAAASLSLSAQGEEDFASRYMKLYAEGTSLTCSTVSPQMMARVMNVAEADNDPHLRQVLSQMKSLRVVRSGKSEESGPLYEKALSLLHHNAQRYQPYGDSDTEDGEGLWVRRKGEVILEIVLLSHSAAEGMSIVDLTGNMDDTFIVELLRL